jgi:lipoyl(octanoyl) transferase
MKLFERVEVYSDFMPRPAAMNMAIDEALLESASAPSIRFYRWESPALSFGYFGRFADVAEYASERDLVRRWTGGGGVFHGDDLTYSLIVPAGDAAFTKSSTSIYENVHCALRDALIANGESSELAAAATVSDRRQSRKGDLQIAPAVEKRRSLDPGVSASSDNCFANPVRADVMSNGRKIAGAAQRRTRNGLLHQGSIQHVDLGNGLAEKFAQALCEKCRERKIDNDALKRARELAEQKYATDAWLRMR